MTAHVENSLIFQHCLGDPRGNLSKHKTPFLKEPTRLLFYAHDPIMEEKSSSTEATIMAALSTLTPPQLSDFTTTISSLFHRHHRRLSTLLSSPSLFSLTLNHLHTLSLHQKSLLIARQLLYILSYLTRFLQTKSPPPPPAATTTNLRDLDCFLLLLLLCELHQHDPESLKSSPFNWRASLSKYVSDTMLTLSGIGFSNSEVLIKYTELVTKCRRFVGIMGHYGKDGKEAATSAAAVVALPSVEVQGGGKECVICKEEMKEGRDVCELPCDHLFHWMCILPWLMKRNTCPCCRYRLPTDDLIGEIDRLWEVLVKIGGGNNSLIECLF